MTDPLPPDPPTSLEAPNRLESWKEIAAFLRRDVRTVQRWEKLDGLPIYRHGPGRLGGVYAYKSELDGWWDKVRAHIENTPTSSAPAVADDAPAGRRDAPPLRDPDRRARPVVWVTLALATLLVGAVLTAVIARWQADRRAGNAGARLGFQARDWVLIARFDNRSGDPALDGVLEYALEHEIGNSRFVNVVPRERIEDTLRLMTKPADTVIDAATGREICVRDGGIRALITGRAERLGRRFLLNATIVDPSTGVTLLSLSEEADGLDQILPRVRAIANNLRERLGETLQSIQTSDRLLERATTPSLRALRLYSRAAEFEIRSNWPAASDLLQQAVAEDSEFATAEIHLAWALRNQGKSGAEYLPHAERALALSNTVMMPERSFIRASYQTMVGNDAEAVTIYEALLSLYPDHYWAANNLAVAYGRLGHADQAVPYFVRLSTLRPLDLRRQVSAAQGLANAGELSLAGQLARRALKRASSSPADEPGFSLLVLLDAYERWLSGDVDGAARDVRAVAATLGTRSGSTQLTLAVNVGYFFLALGQLTDAETALRFTREPALLALVAWLRDDRTALLQHMRDADKADSPGRGPATAVLAARVGAFREGEQTLRRLTRPGVVIPPGSLQAADGELTLRRGNHRRGIGLIEAAMEVLRPNAPASGAFFLALSRWQRRTSAITEMPTHCGFWKPRRHREKRRALPPSQCTGSEHEHNSPACTNASDVAMRPA